MGNTLSELRTLTSRNTQAFHPSCHAAAACLGDKTAFMQQFSIFYCCPVKPALLTVKGVMSMSMLSMPCAQHKGPKQPHSHTKLPTSLHCWTFREHNLTCLPSKVLVLWPQGPPIVD